MIFCDGGAEKVIWRRAIGNVTVRLAFEADPILYRVARPHVWNLDV